MNEGMQEVNLGEGGGDENHRRRQTWATIEDHVRQMNLCLDESYSPLSSSPAGGAANAPVVSRAQKSHHNHKYRKSEGDIHERMLGSQVMNPPQSAPVSNENFELDWNSLSSQLVRNPLREPIPENSMFLPSGHERPHASSVASNENFNETLSTYTSNPGKNASLVNRGIPLPHPSGDAVNRSAMSASHQKLPPSDQYGPTKFSGNSSHLRTSLSSPTLLGNSNSHNIHANALNNPVSYSPALPSTYTYHHQSSASLGQPAVYQNIQSPSARRKSDPIKVSEVSFNRKRSALLNRAQSQLSALNPGYSMPGFAEIPEITDSMEENSTSAETELNYGGKYSDKEYTIALLQHQNDRMNRLKIENDAKKKELVSMMSQVKKMEERLAQRNAGIKPALRKGQSSQTKKLADKNRASALNAFFIQLHEDTSRISVEQLQDDVRRLRDVNRKLEIDCNCMHKEVDYFVREGDSTREDFYSRYNRSFKPKSKKEGSSKLVSVKTDLPPPPVPPPADTDDEPKWRCSHCTFDNHAALNKCEICEFSRTVVPVRTAT